MLVELLQLLLGLYVALGVLTAVRVLVGGFARIDSSASDAPRGFKMLMVPGLVALWPLIVVRWNRGAGRPPEESNAHRQAVASATSGETAS